VSLSHFFYFLICALLNNELNFASQNTSFVNFLFSFLSTCNINTSQACPLDATCQWANQSTTLACTCSQDGAYVADLYQVKFAAVHKYSAELVDYREGCWCFLFEPSFTYYFLLLFSMAFVRTRTHCHNHRDLRNAAGLLDRLCHHFPLPNLRELLPGDLLSCPLVCRAQCRLFCPLLTLETGDYMNLKLCTKY